MEIIEQVVRMPEGPASETPLLLIHGAWRDASCWSELAGHLADLGHRSTAISLPGHGKSTMHKGDIGHYSIRDYVRIVLAELKRMTPAPVIVGHDLGGLLALRAAEELELPGLVLLASVPHTGMRKCFARWITRHPLWMTRQFFRGFRDPWSEKPELAHGLFRGASSNGAAEAFASQLTPESKTIFQQLFFKPEMEVDRIGTRVLVGAASEDAFFTHAEQKALAGAVGGEHVTFPGAPHDLLVGPSSRDVAAAIDGWLAK